MGAAVEPLGQHANSPRLAVSSSVEKFFGALAQPLAIILLNGAVERVKERLALDGAPAWIPGLPFLPSHTEQRLIDWPQCGMRSSYDKFCLSSN